MTLAPVRGGTVFGDAIRVTALDVNGAPVWGQSSCIQSDNLVKVDYTWEWQTGVDVSQTNAQGLICLSYKGRDTTKRINATVQICDDDKLLKNLLTGDTLFTHTPSRVVTDAHTASDTSLTSATANFTSADVGDTVSGTGIFAGSTIASVTNATTVVLSHVTTATATGVTVTITGPTVVEGSQPPKVGVVANPYGCSVEVWMKRIVRDVQQGWQHFVCPRLFLSTNDETLGDAFADMSFKGWGNENANWGSGPMQDFTHDSTGCIQDMYAAALPTPLADGYITITAP